MKKNIAVLGPGSWGTALALMLSREGNKITLWSKFSEHIDEMKKENCNHLFLPGFNFNENITLSDDLEETVKNSDIVLISVPSHAFKETLDNLKHVIDNQPIIWATKGLEPKTSNFLHKLVEEALPKTEYAMLAGPSFAKEVAASIPTAVNIASPNLGLAEDLSIVFRSKCFISSPITDIIGMQLGGVIKNVLAVASGIADGLEFGANTRAAIITMGIQEAINLGMSLGAEHDTLTGLCGIGDTILTCTDNQSRNRRFGLALAHGKSQEEAFAEIGQVVEAAHNVEELSALGEKYNVPMPIVNQVKSILQGKIKPTQLTMALFDDA